MLDRIDEGLFRVLIPFEELTTTVYIVISGVGTAIIDSATYPSDVDRYILPALREAGVDEDKVKYLLASHWHGDHAGGMRRLAEAFPEARVCAFDATQLEGTVALSDGDVLLNCLKVLHLPGHTKDSVGLLDTRSNTLLSGDCLQLKGIGKYRNGVGYPEDYIASVNRLKAMSLRRIIASHEYDPYGSIAEGDGVERYLDGCIEWGV